MRKTSVYLADDEAEGLRRVAIRTGRSQAEMIRDGVRRVIAEEESKPRVFHGMGVGRGDGRSYEPWDADELYEKVMGRR
jgi:Ribbon-helix-helix protein, copG family